MPGESVTIRPYAWLGQFEAGWRWWTGELAAMIPRAIRDAFVPSDAVVAIDVLDSEFIVTRSTETTSSTIARIPRDEVAAQALRLSTPHARGLMRWLADPVVLRFPAEHALVRALTLPIAARRNLHDIVRHEVLRQSPLGAGEIYFDYRIIVADRATSQLDVRLRIVRREGVDDAVKLCRSAGIALSAIEFAGDDARADGGTFPVDDAAARERRLRSRIIPMLALMTLLLFLGFVLSVFVRGQYIAGDLDQRIADAQAHATTVEGLQRDLDAAEHQVSFLSAQKRDPEATAVLSEVTELLPDDTWLYEFERNGDEIRIQGYSAAAASLIGLIDSSPDFRDAEFRAALMQGPNAGLQRFDIAFKLRRSAP